MTCDLCAVRAGLHDFNRLCCRVRYLLALPADAAWKATRRAWLDLWGIEYGQEEMEQTEDAVMAAWQQRREDARSRIAALTSKIAQERTR